MMPSLETATNSDSSSNGAAVVVHREDASQRPGEHNHELADNTLVLSDLHSLGADLPRTSDDLAPFSADVTGAVSDVASPTAAAPTNPSNVNATPDEEQMVDAAIATLLMLVGEADDAATTTAAAATKTNKVQGPPCFQHSHDYEGAVDAAFASLLLGEDVSPEVLTALGAALEQGIGEYASAPRSWSGDGAKAADRPLDRLDTRCHPAELCRTVQSSNAAASASIVTAAAATMARAVVGPQKRRRGRARNGTTPAHNADATVASSSRRGLSTAKNRTARPQRRGQYSHGLTRTALERPAHAEHELDDDTLQLGPCLIAAGSADGSATAKPVASMLGAVVTTCSARPSTNTSTAGCPSTNRTDDSPSISNNRNDSDADCPSPRKRAVQFTLGTGYHIGDALASRAMTPTKPPKNGKRAHKRHQSRQEPRTVGEVSVRARIKLAISDKTSFQPNSKPNNVKGRRKQDNLFRLCCYMCHFKCWTITNATQVFNYCPHEPSVVRRYELPRRSWRCCCCMTTCAAAAVVDECRSMRALRWVCLCPLLTAACSLIGGWVGDAAVLVTHVKMAISYAATISYAAGEIRKYGSFLLTGTLCARASLTTRSTTCGSASSWWRAGYRRVGAISGCWSCTPSCSWRAAAAVGAPPPVPMAPRLAERCARVSAPNRDAARGTAFRAATGTTCAKRRPRATARAATGFLRRCAR
jgi:hypothetical protein